MGVALKSMACGIILSHNHPSGSLVPSSADRQLTDKIKEAGKLMDISLLDHIIISPSEGSYYSFADEGLI
jgi:DNA repair protein RadC